MHIRGGIPALLEFVLRQAFSLQDSDDLTATAQRFVQEHSVPEDTAKWEADWGHVQLLLSLKYGSEEVAAYAEAHAYMYKHRGRFTLQASPMISEDVKLALSRWFLLFKRKGWSTTIGEEASHA